MENIVSTLIPTYPKSSGEPTSCGNLEAPIFRGAFCCREIETPDDLPAENMKYETQSHPSLLLSNSCQKPDIFPVRCKKQKHCTDVADKLLNKLVWLGLHEAMREVRNVSTRHYSFRSGSHRRLIPLRRIPFE